MSLIERMRPRPGLRGLVTAGASGIGVAIARAFIEAEAKVLVCDIDRNALGRFAADHLGTLATLADLSEAAAVDALLGAAGDRLGGLDVLVNNAGISGPTGRIEELAVGDIRRTLEVDLMGQFLTVRRAVPLLRQSAGAVINISSVAGRLGYALRTPYAAAKWGIVGLTASLAKELGPDGIRVNAILPGVVVRGARIEGGIRARAAAEGISYDEMEAREILQLKGADRVGF